MVNSKDTITSKESKSHIWILIIAMVVIIVGTLVLLYPIVSNLYNSYHQANVIQQYNNVISNTNDNKINSAREEAIEYNENLIGDPVHDPFVSGSGYALPENYTEVLNLGNDGVMGEIIIPKINVELPIYHGTSADTLEKGVGHIEQTTLPIGGKGTHAVLTGHRGLPSSELFSRLDEMEIGDNFYINILNDTLAYEVYNIEIILPNELEQLFRIDNEDIITLVTCTPYGVNTHRLLVQGKRVPYTINLQDDVSKVSIETTETNIKYSVLGIFVGVFIIISVFIIIIINKVKKQKL